MKTKFLLNNIFYYLLSFMVILSCQSLVSKIQGDNMMTMLCIIVMLLCIVAELKYVIKGKRLQYIIFVMYIISLSILFIFGDFLYLYFIIIHLIFAGMVYFWFFLGNAENKIIKIMNSIKNLLIVISIISIVCFLFCTVFDFIQPSVIYNAKKIGWSNYDYRVYGYLYNDGQMTDIFGYRVLRNIGIFVEAPMYAYLLIISLYIQMFLTRTNLFNELILIVAIVTTLSSTGFVFCIIFLLIKYRRVFSQHKIILLITTPIVLIIGGCIIYAVLKDKLLTGNLSGIIRIDDFLASIKSFINAPIVGNGYMNSRALDPFRTGMRANVSWNGKLAGLSSGIGGILSNGGVIFAWFYIFPFIIAIKNIILCHNEKNIYMNFFVIVVFLLLCNTIVYIVAIGPFMNILCWYIVLIYNANHERFENF